MAEGDDALVEELIKDLLPANFSQLSEAEQIAQAKSALHRFEAMLNEHRSELDAAAAKHRRKTASPELPQLVGEVVMAAAWAEDAAGTLLQASSGDWGVRARGYDDTSTSLVKSLKKHVPAEVIGRLQAALELRHFVVHGFFVEASFLGESRTVKTWDFISMKRSWRTEAPQREVKAFTADALRSLAQEFWDIEEVLERLHSEAILGKAGHGDR